MNYATGWACNLKDLFVRFPYEKYKSLNKITHQKIKKYSIISQVFIASLKLILEDIVKNNDTFVLPNFKHLMGEIHIEAIKGKEFEKCYKNGKFLEVDFIESLFTGHQIYFYIQNRKNGTYRLRKIPIYVSKMLKDIITERTNKGLSYG